MFQLAIIIGIYSYILFFLGIIQMLYREVVIGVTLVLFVTLIYFYKKSLKLSVEKVHKELKLLGKEKLSLVLICVISLQALVNLIGALGPELAFDALWYHLTFPKLYLLNHAVFHIPGGLLYYSDMPKLGELLYTGAIAFGNESIAKVLHLVFGLLVAVVIYIFSRKFFSQTISLVAVVIFYSNLVVAWESITAYVDLIRTFYELLALYAFVNWWQSKQLKWFILSAIMVGLAVATKLLALGSLGIFLILLVILLTKRREQFAKSTKKLLTYLFITLLIPLPWFVFATIHTGNPVYPFFTSTYSVDPSVPDPILMIRDITNIFLFSPDPISPIYLLFLPLTILAFTRLRSEIKLLIVYCTLSLLLWYFTPRTGGGRFLMPYLPAFSIVCAAVIQHMFEMKERYYKILFTYLIFIIVIIAISTIGYRAVANYKYIPVISGGQTKDDFLKNNLNFSFGDFYDVDGYFAENIKPTDHVLVYGIHNLYYVNFPFTHESWIKKGDKFNYIVIQEGALPERFRNWKVIYENKITNIRLYSDGGKEWVY